MPIEIAQQNLEHASLATGNMTWSTGQVHFPPQGCMPRLEQPVQTMLATLAEV